MKKCSILTVSILRHYIVCFVIYLTNQSRTTMFEAQPIKNGWRHDGSWRHSSRKSNNYNKNLPFRIFNEFHCDLEQASSTKWDEQSHLIKRTLDLLCPTLGIQPYMTTRQRYYFELSYNNIIPVYIFLRFQIQFYPKIWTILRLKFQNFQAGWWRAWQRSKKSVFFNDVSWISDILGNIMSTDETGSRKFA